MRKSGEYEDGSGSEAGSGSEGGSLGYAYSESDEGHSYRELEAWNEPRRPETLYDPYRSQSSSRSRSRSPPPAYDSRVEYDDREGESPSSSSSYRSGKNNSYAQEYGYMNESERMVRDDRSGNEEEEYAEEAGEKRGRSRPAYSLIARAVEAASSDDPQHPTRHFPKPIHQHYQATTTLAAAVGHDSNDNDDDVIDDYAYSTYPRHDEQEKEQEQPLSYAMTPMTGSYFDPHVSGSGINGSGNGRENADIEIGFGRPLDVPSSPFSPGGERAARAAAARGWRSEWYKSPPNSGRREG